MEALPKGSKKLLNAWAFYDWANSVYSLVIASAIFPIFYGAITIVKDADGNKLNDTVNFLGRDFNNDTLISYVTAAAFLMVSFLSPLLSGIADYVGNKKFFMKFFCYLGALSCIGLYWFDTDFLWFGLLCYFLALIGFWGSLVFYNSYLPDIAFPDQQDRISAKGYSLGYIGSVILLCVCLAMILMHKTFGFENEDFPTRFSFILTGLWWIGFSQYTYYYLPKGNKKEKLTNDVLFNGFKELKKIWKKLKHDKPMRTYLTAFFVYSMAVQTIMLIATYFGIEELDWGETDSTTGLIVSILLIQLVAVGGAWFTSKASARYGNIQTLIVINIIWIGICVYAYFITTPIQFYVTAAFVGLVMGGIQSLSRSTYSKLIPEGEKDTASYFSFYDVSEKIGIVIGMSTYGFIAEQTSIRYAILFFIAFFVVGVILLFFVPRKRIIEQAE
ncbi:MULTISPECIES: MFS transporter [unclassified Leeuwenhoekiella]|uniref:MFS transporter n=1 Tax=unclassified Leeuwenhoekiella TaxID=2615029 RepID=UPI000C42F4A2|nr:MULTISPECIES: MFS transporter [unclassified Leeuwenhoekiella]MAW95557.1 MFS transporter [Leeuwenhoekiella sp.]MBA82351.1 MFS transporter [Leeuwenhoekiella sp.]|tara:strand:- start:1194 stop:2525 length:1332 start_codon:yes stop_codon:yes gene_type:complete